MDMIEFDRLKLWPFYDVFVTICVRSTIHYDFDVYFGTALFEQKFRDSFLKKKKNPRNLGSRGAVVAHQRGRG
jgi:hypothetical protein